MAHDDYYNKLQHSADSRLQRASNAFHEADDCKERFEQLAHIVGAKVASVIEAFVDGKIAYHELHENK